MIGFQLDTHFLAGSISGKVLVDLDCDDATPPRGSKDQVVRLLEGSTLIEETSTRSDGSYVFTDVAPGTYTVKVAGVERGIAVSDLDNEPNFRTIVSVGPGENIQNVDFVYKRKWR